MGVKSKSPAGSDVNWHRVAELRIRTTGPNWNKQGLQLAIVIKKAGGQCTEEGIGLEVAEADDMWMARKEPNISSRLTLKSKKPSGMNLN